MQSFWGITVSVEVSEKLVASCRLHSETVMHQGGRLDTRDEPKSEAMLGNTDQHMGDAMPSVKMEEWARDLRGRWG